MSVRVAPYGSWESPVVADMLAGANVRLMEPRIDGNDIYWLEGRPLENGRVVLVRRDCSGGTHDVTPPPYYVRTTVHEYGGGAYTVHRGTVYFSNFMDQQVYSVVPGEAPVPVTRTPGMRYADYAYDSGRNRLVCVREDHTGSSVLNALVSVDLLSGEVSVLASGSDFYASPRISPDGKQLAWVQWNHPNMPWDSTELWVGNLSADGLCGCSIAEGGDGAESVLQPEWSPSGVLHYISDRSGWWQIYRLTDKGRELAYELAAEFGRPAWSLGMSCYAIASNDLIYCSYIEEGFARLSELDPHAKTLRKVEAPYVTVDGIRFGDAGLVFVGGSSQSPDEVVNMPRRDAPLVVLRHAAENRVDSGYVSVAQPVAFPTTGGKTARAFYYAPTNPGFRGPEAEKPPLVVMSHGGPTGAATAALNLTIQYFTSRGLAVVDVNYGGSTGYGREYRNRLLGKWGVVDVDDCVNAVKYLVERGLADAGRVAIRGGSAGGYTTMACLTFTDVFAAGASYYGVADLEALAKDTHKFESRYLDSMVGPYPAARALYFERSPVHFIERISCPMLVLQGLDDKVVPPNQSEMMVEQLRKKGLPVAYITFAGESHGFRKASTIKRAIEAELYFYSRVFRFALAGSIEPGEIENALNLGNAPNLG